MTNRTPAARSSDYVITCMITDRIGLHSVLLPLLNVHMEDVSSEKYKITKNCQKLG